MRGRFGVREKPAPKLHRRLSVRHRGRAAGRAAAAAPYVPKDDAVVLERLPIKPADPVARELRELRAQLAATPDDVETAVDLARRYFRLALSEGDPRFVGYAEATLRPWWSAPNPPHDVLVMRALLQQYRHEFGGALDTLGAAAKSDPADPEVHLWRAAILLVQADYAGAASACEALRGTGHSLDYVGCKTSVDGVTGNAAQAYALLSNTLAGSRRVRGGARLWMLTRLAEFSLVLGEHDRAEQHFREALALGVNDQFLLAAYADFLLDRGRPAEVVALLKQWTRSDTLLLRLALAEKATEGTDARRARTHAEGAFRCSGAARRQAASAGRSTPASRSARATRPRVVAGAGELDAAARTQGCAHPARSRDRGKRSEGGAARARMAGALRLRRPAPAQARGTS